MPPSNPNNYPFGLHTVSQLSTAATQAQGAEQCAQFSCSLCEYSSDSQRSCAPLGTHMDIDCVFSGRFVTHDQST